MRRLLALMAIVLAVTAGSGVMTACAPSVPSEYIQPGELEDILYDYHMGKALADYTTHGTDLEYQRRLYFYAVLEKYGRTEAEFDSSMIYYYSHADRLAKIYDKVADRMAKTANEIGAASDATKGERLYAASGDTADIWHNSTMVVLMPTPPYNRMDFEVEVDTTFRTGDSFRMEFTAEFMYEGGGKEGVVYVAVTLSNDSIVGYSRNFTSGLRGQVKIPANKKYDVKAISGFIYLGGGARGRDGLRIMTVGDIHFLRFHKVEKPAEEEEEDDDTRSRKKGGMKDEDTLKTHGTAADSSAAPKTLEDTAKMERKDKPKKPPVKVGRKTDRNTSAATIEERTDKQKPSTADKQKSALKVRKE